MRVDPATNHACTILAGQPMTPMTAVAVMPESGRGLAVTTVLGDVLRVRLPG